MKPQPKRAMFGFIITLNKIRLKKEKKIKEKINSKSTNIWQH